MALSESDIDKAVEAVLHGAEERYAGELADITAELAKRAADGGWDASELAQLAAEFEQRASEVTAAYAPSIRSEAQEAVADAVAESALAELAMLAALTAAHKAARGTRNAAGAAVAAAANANAPKIDEAAQKAAEKRVRAIADYAAKGVADSLARQNLSMTATAARAWREAAQRAALDSLAGNLPQDAAIERAYRELGGSFRVQHASGRRDSVDVALRRMMATELSQASGRATLANLDAAGWQLAHTDAHYGARPSHAEWQGRPFGVNGPVTVDGIEYPGMAELTGYGTATGLKGVNCRHTIEVYVPGETEPPDTEFREDSALHNGMTSEEYYQAVQRQRALERAVRGTRYQVAMMEKMGMGLEHPSYVQKRLELGNWQAKLAKHCKANNLTRIPSREQAYGIGKQPRGLTGRKWSESEKGISGKTMKSEGAKVDLDYIKSPEYRKKFEGLTPYRNVNMELHKCAVAALTHRNGTTCEDLHLSIEDGKVKAKNTSSKTHLSVGATSTINKAVEDNRGMLIGLHNHPSNVPPSGADFAASGYRDYAFGLVVLHDGEVYKYKHGNIPFLARGFDDCVERQRQKGYNEKEAFEIAMKEYSDRFGITWEKIQ